MSGINSLLAYLMQLLLICVGSTPLSVISYTSTRVGLTAVLPCSVASQQESEQALHIQWQTVSNSVFERMGEELFLGENYRDRADVPEHMLVKGNCSLLLQDVRFSDAGVYESYLVVGEPNKVIKNRIFLQSVKLVVIDHKVIKSVHSGSDLTLDLYTHQAVKVIFQSSNDTGWTVLWKRDGNNEKGYHAKERGNKLILRRISASSAGMYKVLDSQGSALSTIKVTVTESAVPKETEILQIQSAYGRAALSVPSLSLITLFLVFHLMVVTNLIVFP